MSKIGYSCDNKDSLHEEEIPWPQPSEYRNFQAFLQTKGKQLEQEVSEKSGCSKNQLKVHYVAKLKIPSTDKEDLVVLVNEDFQLSRRTNISEISQTFRTVQSPGSKIKRNKSKGSPKSLRYEITTKVTPKVTFPVQFEFVGKSQRFFEFVKFSGKKSKILAIVKKKQEKKAHPKNYAETTTENTENIESTEDILGEFDLEKDLFDSPLPHWPGENTNEKMVVEPIEKLDWSETGVEESFVPVDLFGLDAISSTQSVL